MTYFLYDRINRTIVMQLTIEDVCNFLRDKTLNNWIVYFSPKVMFIPTVDMDELKYVLIEEQEKVNHRL